MVTDTRERTGQLATLLSTLQAYRRGSRIIHAAEETVQPMMVQGQSFVHRYPEMTALCGERGGGAAERPLGEVSCGRCRRTARFREVT